jgi:hypothetical protein
MDEVLLKAERAVAVSLTSNGWAPFNLMPTRDSFETTWDAFRVDLAGHLAWSEWEKLAAAVALYGAIRSMTQEELPQESEETLDELGKALNIARRQLGRYRARRFSVWRSFQRHVSKGDWSARRAH